MRSRARSIPAGVVVSLGCLPSRTSCGSQLVRKLCWLATEMRAPVRVATSVRIGISKETTRLLRFYEAGMQGYTYLEDVRDYSGS